jgi:hypothetical protein
MGALSCCPSILWRRAPAGKDSCSNSICGNTVTRRGSAGHEAEPPLSCAELIAAAAFLDFGGMLDERWLSGRCPDRGGDGSHRG